MRLSNRSEYALLALVYLGRNPGRTVSVAEIAREQEIPPKFLEQILAELKRNRYVRSTKGRSGGYELAKDPKVVTLAEIVRNFDGPLAPTDSVSQYYYRTTPLEREPRLLQVMTKVRNSIAKIMEGTVLKDIM